MSVASSWFRGNRPVFLVLALFIVICFLMGGGSRPDILSLIILRPIGAMLFVFGIASLDRKLLNENRWLVIGGIAVFLYPLIQLIPLPPGLWHALPGRDIIETIDDVAGLEDQWRPISMVPFHTWNSWFALLLPLAALALGVRLTSAENARLLSIVLVLGLISGFIGLLQAIGSSSLPLYFYRITNDGLAVGLFANRNHQAALLAMLFPILAVWASRPAMMDRQIKMRLLIAVSAAIILLPLILVTGSRAGLLLSIAGIGSAFVLYQRPEKAARREGAQRIDWRIPAAVGGVLLLCCITIAASRAEALSRLASADSIEETRWGVWNVTQSAIWTYFPVGSGLGTFVEVFRIHEPYDLLKPQYTNHAHNDYLEFALTGGLPAVLFGLAALGLFLWSGWTVWRQRLSSKEPRRFDIMLARLGTVCIALLLLASVPDYPLRTPTLSVLAAVFTVWLARGVKAARGARSNNQG